MKTCQLCICLAVVALLPQPGAAAQGAPPLAGCYERIYDATHLSAHNGQIVIKVRLAVAAPSDPDMGKDIVAEAPLTFWVKKIKQPFTTSGVCHAAGSSLVCKGSLAATEIDDCPNQRDGVRDCRINWPDAAGSFHILPRPDGVLVTIPGRLEIPGPDETDGVPFLYLSVVNAENHEFRLKSVAAKRCR